jgi:hypothetical protein
MARPTKIDLRTTLAERLRAEACESRPAFSEELHARICDGVWQCGVPGTSQRVFGRSVGLAAVASAAALLLAAAVLHGPSWQPARPGAGKASGAAASRPASPTVSTEPAGSESGFELVTDLTDRAIEHFESLFDAADAAGQWAYLDHGAPLALESLSERLPINLVPMTSSEPSDPAESSSGW